MNLKVCLAFVVGIVLIASINGVDTTATTPATSSSTATPTTTIATTTPKPLVITKDSALCKKCSCLIDIFELNCNNKSMTQWFNDDEWNTLTNGNIAFTTIRMEHNNLTNIPLLKPMSVQNLYLGHNNIAKIENAAFRNLLNLTVLDLSFNNMTAKTLRPEVFQGNYNPENYQPLEKVIQLNLGHNMLHSLVSDVFEHLPKLEILNLGSNVFQVVDHSTEIAIGELAHLKTLDMSFMELKKLPDNLFHSPRDLENLILTGNLLTKLPEGLHFAINLKSLTLDDNLLENLEGINIFPSLPKLESLSVSYCNDLEKIGEGAFGNLTSLKKLDLSDNTKLSYLHPKAFAKPTVNPIIFDYPPLEELNLHRNNLSLLDHDLLERWDKVKIIDLRYNPWHCDCDNSYLIHTLIAQIKETSPVFVTDILCSSPAAWESKQLITLHDDKNILRCEDSSTASNDGHLLIGLVIGLLVGIPISLGTILAYRRGYFGRIFNRGHTGQSLYNRASFQDDFHI